MGSFKLQITGLQQLQQRLSKTEVDKKVNEALNSFGNAVRTTALQLAPVNEGRLRQGIFYQVGNLQVTIGCNVDYAAYLEFGTRKFAAKYVSSLPAEWKEFASQYKGSGGGTFEQFVMRIYEWVRKKGIRSTGTTTGKGKKTKEQDQRQLAYVIALKILREGIKPQPFLYPAFEKNRAILNKKLEL